MMITKDIIPKAHHCFRDINPDVWTDLSIYVGQIEYEAVALKAQLAAKERELTEANERLEKFSGMCLSCPDMGMTLVVERLEQELDEVNALVSDAVKAMEILTKQARLQRALDRIEKAGLAADIRRNGKGYLVELYVPDEWDAIDSFYGATRAEAAEAAAQWAESQKEGEA